ncbi:Uncharacterized protein TCM_022407 [Theobroma cacao]|uniref:Reverse transcriptase zinc-binding domain-containing protein n=1 Tax=Theobroma cacao TaxID=3641 RepID=A0A061F0Q4_THECC|nr:Uncharacterized protein TCM_022407 [Theobroma cacao]
MDRSLGSSAACCKCGARVEDMSHAFRDCRPTKLFLLQCSTSIIEEAFFYMSSKDWVLDNIFNTLNNISNAVTYENLPWNLFFIHALWFLWYWRNLRKFDHNFRWPSN